MVTRYNSREGDLQTPDVIALNPQTPDGIKTRELIKWRVPGLGFVEMYINPQSLNITEKKITSKQRTKGGYVVQYFGEELMRITLSGSTGSSGIEGINILRKVYRAEQDAFDQVAQQLADRVNAFSVGGNLASLISQGSSQAGGNFAGSLAGGVVTGLLGGNTEPSTLPTLGSLAVSVEMYYQGWVFKGIFDSFTVQESVNNGVGIFTYTLEFTVLERRGVRSNFATFHRSPATYDDANNPIDYNQSDSNTTPMTFGGKK